MSSGFASVTAQFVFWLLTGYGWFIDELTTRRAALFGILWAAGYVASGRVAQGAFYVSSFVAVLDIALVFIIFKGDVRLT